MRPQEKGIDLVIGLDVVEFLITGVCDVAIIVSLDRDLYEIPQAIQNLGRLIARPIRLEAAVPVPDGQKQPKILPGSPSRTRSPGRCSSGSETTSTTPLLMAPGPHPRFRGRFPRSTARHGEPPKLTQNAALTCIRSIHE